jgi:Bacterial PH domain
MAYHRGMRFPAPWDRTNRVSTTAAILVLTAVVIAAGALTAAIDAAAAPVVVAIVAASVAATLGLGWALAPKGYALLGDQLRIERPLRAIEIPLRTIHAAVALPDGALKGSLKVMGSSGFFGWYGRFWNRKLGAFRAYATRRDGLVLVDAGADRFVLSPEPVGPFVEALLSRAPAATRSAPDSPLSPKRTPRRVLVGLALLVALVPLAVGGTFVAVWAFSPVAARVERGEIRIERNAAPAVVIPLAEVRRVERLAPEYARHLWRVAGTSVPGGVRYGHFRSRELGDVRLYAWRADAYVLLDTAGGRVVVTPDDADGFVAAVRAGIAR